MKSCPTCGAVCADADAFCESDGTQLSLPVTSPPSSQHPPPLASDACAMLDHGVPSPGMRFGAYMVRQTAGDRATASSPDGTEVLLVVGEPEVLADEAAAIEAIGEHRYFPRVIEHERDRTGAFLALSAPPWSSQMLADVVQNRTVEQTVAAISGVIVLAAVVEQAGFAFQPSASDLFLAPSGAVLLSRLRGARRLPAGERLDARRLIESLSEVFLAPAIRGPTSLVRLVVPARDSGEAGRTVDDVRMALAAVREELSAPAGQADIAELCDPGLWRPYNQDATAIDHGVSPSGEPFAVMVVCDGVSSSAYSERASRLAARAARDAMGHYVRSADVGHEVPSAVVAQAIRAAHLAVCAEHVAEPVSDPPGTTIAAALVFRKRLTVGWVGDSRAYWFTSRGAEQLTHDHSWVNEAIARGEVKDADEVQGALAHTITRCLGPLEVGDALLEIDPDVRSRDLPGPGIVLLCSDGLWNYAPKPADLAAVIRAAGDETNALDVARILVNYALARGGQDNVSVAVYSHAQGTG